MNRGIRLSTVPNPVVLYLSLFLLTHLLFGADLYLKNTLMLEVTAIFMAILIASTLVWGLVSSGLRPSLSLAGDLNLQRLRLVKLFLYFLLLIKLGSVIIALGAGLSYSSLRRDIGEILPPSILIPLDNLASALFLIIIFWQIFFQNKKKSALWLTTICAAVFLASGSRSYALFFPFCAAMAFYIEGTLKLKVVAALGLIFPPLMGLISGIRLYLTHDPYELSWYVQNNIFVEGSWSATAINLVFFQVRDMVIRTSEIFLQVPDVVGFQHGKSLFFGFYSMLPGKQLNPAVEIHHKIFGVALDQETPFPPTTVVQLYLDFNILGVAIFAILYAIVLYYIYYRALFKPSISALCCLSVLSYFFCLSLYGDLETLRLAAVLFFLFLASRFVKTRGQAVRLTPR